MKAFSKKWWLKYTGISVTIDWKANEKSGKFIKEVSTVGNRDKLSREDVCKVNNLIRKHM